MPADPHKPLRDDVRLLGQLLGETLRTHVGQDIFETVETVRAMAKSAREGDETDFARLKQTLDALPVDHALPVARAFAHFLRLANIAEQHHRVRHRRAYQRDSNALPQRDSCDEAFAALLDAGIAPETLYQTVCALDIEFVLTAHPTEVMRRTLMQTFAVGRGAAFPTHGRSCSAPIYRQIPSRRSGAHPLWLLDGR